MSLIYIIPNNDRTLLLALCILNIIGIKKNKHKIINTMLTINIISNIVKNREHTFL
jgi:hypothetical protein